jgi:hypothetical protein
LKISQKAAFVAVMTPHGHTGCFVGEDIVEALEKATPTPNTDYANMDPEELRRLKKMNDDCFAFFDKINLEFAVRAEASVREHANALSATPAAKRQYDDFLAVLAKWIQNRKLVMEVRPGGDREKIEKYQDKDGCCTERTFGTI